jgi:Uncharacterized distant relative of cell wall-associated hydrolases
MLKDFNMAYILKSPSLRLWIFSIIFVVLLILIGDDNLQLLTGSRQSVIYTYADNFIKGEIGSGFGQALNDKVSLTGLEPGDIILGGWTNCAYGKYSHAGLYVGDNQVIEGYVDYGLSVQELSHYLEYTRLCLLRVEASPEIKQKAVDYALARKGEMFYPVAFKQGDRFWNCTKIIWEAYQVQGINLDKINDLWIAPESLQDSPSVKILYEKGSPNS